MQKGLIVVLGASGHIGGGIAAKLLAAHRRVRVVARDADRLHPLAAQGAEILAGSLEEPEMARRALAGAFAAFTLLPPPSGALDDLRAWQNHVSANLAGALREAGTRYVVNLSSVGAEVPFGTGPIAGLHDHEERMDALDANIVHLRAAFFMENHLQSIGTIRAQGANASTLRGDLALPMIATRDIAEEAARLLSSLEFEDKSTSELLGPRDYTLTEATRILGTAIGRPQLPYVQISEDVMRGGLRAHGVPETMVEAMLEMLRAFESGKVRAAEPRLPENTTPTTLEEWASGVFAEAYASAT